MTAEEAHAIAEAAWGAAAVAWEPAGEPRRCILGQWVPLGAIADDGVRPLILRTSRQGVRVHGEGATWEEAIAAAGLGELAARLAAAAARRRGT